MIIRVNPHYIKPTLSRYFVIGPFDYSSLDYLQPWRFRESQNRLQLEFTPFKDRPPRTKLGVIFSQVHQMFGLYSGMVITDEGETIEISNLIAFAEEHHARW